MAQAPTKTLVESAYQRLRTDIIEGKLAPDAKLRIEELREEYETGASPLREALNRLAGEGFVTVEGQRGFRVSSTSLDDLMDLTRMRIMLECEALRESIEKGDDEWEANILAAYHRLTKAEELREQNFSEWEQRNHDFHEALIAACTSPWLLRLRNTLYEQHKRYRLISVMAHDESRDPHLEHEEIKNAAIARDIAAACEATKNHILRTVETSKSALLQSEQDKVA